MNNRSKTKKISKIKHTSGQRIRDMFERDKVLYSKSYRNIFCNNTNVIELYSVTKIEQYMYFRISTEALDTEMEIFSGSSSTYTIGCIDLMIAVYIRI